MLKGLEKTIEDLGLQSVTAQVSNSGSYRTEHVLTFLERALPATADTALAGHWRLIYCDRYRAHESDAMLRLAWQHRAIVLLHGGGTTGVAQVNDTHLHGPLSKAYQELEMHLGVVKLILEPNSCPHRDRKDCVRDLALVWGRSDLHLTALAGWKANMITNALDGSEDRLASSEIRAFWDELDMSTRRTAIIEEICTECEAGRLQWSFEVVYSLVEAFETTGFLDVYEEGQEDEGEEQDVAPLGERPWQDTDGPSSAEEDTPAPEEAPVRLAPPLTQAQQAEADGHAARLRALADAEALAPSDIRLQKAFAEVRRTLLKESSKKAKQKQTKKNKIMLKESSGRGQADAEVALAMRAAQSVRRDAVDQLNEELKRRRLERQAQQVALVACHKALDAKTEALRREEIALATAGRRAAEVEAVAARRRQLQRVSHGFTSNELGQGQPSGGGERYRRARADLLQLVANLGQELPVEIEANWAQWVRRWDAQGCRQHARAWGSVVRDEMVGLVAKINGGERAAVIQWHRRWTRRWCLDRHDVVVPGAAGASADGGAAAA